ncbi:MAG: MoxR family ATPase [Firmicutes bacterium]|nr:MoxR family ATPase [Bacillota bacterium]
MSVNPPSTKSPIDSSSLNQAIIQLQQAHSRISQQLFGVDPAIDQLFTALLSGGHILLEDVPGTGKTSLTKAFAEVLGLSFARIQCTPDLLPADITGGLVYHPKSGDFELRKGPIFANILLVDEINRALPRTQSALLEAMAEGQVTLDGQTHALPEPFMVIATQNPLESQGVFPLPEAQLDRFLMKTSLGYPTASHDLSILQFHLQSHTLTVPSTLQEQSVPLNLPQLQSLVENVFLHEDILRYIVAIVRATREQPDVRIGASPRAMIMLAKAARATALVRGRSYVTPDDVQSICPTILLHRMVMQSFMETGSDQEREWTRLLLESVPAPLEAGLL